MNSPLTGAVPLVLVLITLGLGFLGAPLWSWTVLFAAWLLYAGAAPWVWALAIVFAIVFNLPALRRVLATSLVLRLFRAVQLFPRISDTERAALQAGDVWMDRELFSGRPDLARMLQQPNPKLTSEEQAFLDGPVNDLCEKVSDWEFWRDRELPEAAWKLIKEHRFFGMIIPKEYGGLGFSAFGHSEVIMKLISRSNALGITCMVPNSLGPAELLIHYGTTEQKNHYLPRLARGEEIPCFALTEPEAGSDAASIQASGEVFRGEDGALYLRLNWNKRWITLASIATTLGLAFRLRDPGNLLGKGEDVGITCALIPRDTPGVTASRRHDPLGVPFYNCPTQGRDVVVPVSAIIGGPDRAGQGWNMLMESLAAGRGISLPAESAGTSKFTTRVVSAFMTVRRQFNAPLGAFEGVQEALARIAGFTYLIESARLYTSGGLNAGVKPPVITAMMKYLSTELRRRVVSDGMDLSGGVGISMGPRNLLGHHYIGTPISITVEGANILTRTLITFGQGATRAHPFAYREIDAFERGDLVAFDAAFWGHLGHVIRNFFRVVLLGLTRGLLARSPTRSVGARYWRRLSWSSAQFALCADLFMGALGGKLRIKEKLTGRFADILAWMYFAAATLHRFENDGALAEDEPLLRWSLEHAFAQIQLAFEGLLLNAPIPVLGWILRYPVRLLSRINPLGRGPSDELDFAVAGLSRKPGPQREQRLTGGIYVPIRPEEQLCRLESAFRLSIEADRILSKARKALRGKTPRKLSGTELAQAAHAAGAISQEELGRLTEAEKLRREVIQVDDFSQAEYLSRGRT